MDTEILSILYKENTGMEPETAVRIAGEGSNRRYYRLDSRGAEAPLVGVIGTNLTENRAFIGIARHFAAKGLPVPRVLAVSPDEMAYLQTDLGDTPLFRAIAAGRATGQFSPEELKLLERTISILPRFQHEGGKGLDFSLCFPVEEFDRQSVQWDLNYFKYCFLKATGMEFSEPELEREFEKMTDKLLGIYASQPRDVFMVRDFQSRNVMLSPDGEPYLIDFQGGRRGPAHYDVASFLWQAKANLPDDLRQHLVDVYLHEAARFMPEILRDNGAEFRRELLHFALFRVLQTLGAYGFRGEFERKNHFLESIPLGLANALNLLEELEGEYPHLASVLKAVDRSGRYAREEPHEGLMVRVLSFSYRKGLPADSSGNGGGFVFDCRSIHNPGRYDEFKSLTGRDQPVINFLVDHGDAAQFLRHCYALVDTAVERYLSRGFTDLMVAFGCTGGRHRSVYCAESMARHIALRYPTVTVDLNHREQSIHERF